MTIMVTMMSITMWLMMGTHVDVIHREQNYDCIESPTVLERTSHHCPNIRRPGIPNREHPDNWKSFCLQSLKLLTPDLIQSPKPETPQAFCLNVPRLPPAHAAGLLLLAAGHPPREGLGWQKVSIGFGMEYSRNATRNRKNDLRNAMD